MKYAYENLILPLNLFFSMVLGKWQLKILSVKFNELMHDKILFYKIPHRGASLNYVDKQGGVCQMLTLVNEGGGGSHGLVNIDKLILFFKV